MLSNMKWDHRRTAHFVSLIYSLPSQLVACVEMTLPQFQTIAGTLVMYVQNYYERNCASCDLTEFYLIPEYINACHLHMIYVLFVLFSVILVTVLLARLTCV